MNIHLNRGISTEIRQNVSHLPLYNNGPGVDYTDARVAYALNITLLHDPLLVYDPQSAFPHPSPEARILIAQRGAGQGASGLWSGVSGFIDTLSDPAGVIPDEDFDPVMYTVREELEEECGMSAEAIAGVSVALGKRFELPYGNGGVLHLLPLLGYCVGPHVPEITIDNHELTDFGWPRLNEALAWPGLNEGYGRVTLPAVLGSLGLSRARIQTLLTA